MERQICGIFVRLSDQASAQLTRDGTLDTRPIRLAPVWCSIFAPKSIVIAVAVCPQRSGYGPEENGQKATTVRIFVVTLF